MLNREIQLAEQELKILKQAVDQIVSLGCAYCWVNDFEAFKGSHSDHLRHGHFTVWFNRMRQLHFQQFHSWPLCYFCWIPFRAPFNHEPFPFKAPANTSKCPHHDTIPHILPTVICHILTMQPDDKRNKVLASLAQKLNVQDSKSWLVPTAFCQWLMQPPLNTGEIPRPAQFVIAFYKLYRILPSVDSMDVDISSA